LSAGGGGLTNGYGDDGKYYEIEIELSVVDPSVEADVTIRDGRYHSGIVGGRDITLSRLSASVSGQLVHDS
jgi:hypothetical protein